MKLTTVILKVRPYLLDTIKHLIVVIQHFGIAFQPAVNDIALPRRLLQ